MNLFSTIKLSFLLLCATSAVYAQNDIEKQKLTSGQQQISLDEKSVIFNLGFYKPLTTEHSYIGQATRGQVGFDFGMQVFVYKKIFVGGFAGYSFLEVINTKLVGNYTRSRVFNTALEVGYELPLIKNIDLGISIAPLGYATYRNYIGEGRVNQQRDEAYLTAIRVHFNYQFATNFGIFLRYAFRNDHTSIETASEIQDNFNNIQYHDIGVGLKYTLFK